jgi:hypothetical protein
MMRRTSWLTSIVFVILSCWSSLSAQEWRQVANADEAFTVSMLKQPEVVDQKLTFGQFQLSGRKYSSSVEGSTYFVWSFRNSNQAMKFDRDSYSVLDASADLAWDSLLMPLRESLPKEKRANMEFAGEFFDGILARMYKLWLGDATGRAQIYANEQTLYVLVALQDGTNSTSFEPFFNSFKLKADAPGFILMGDPKTSPTVVVAASPDPNDYNRVFSGREVSQKVHVTSKQEPTYTDAARKYGVQGMVVLRAVFTRDGVVDRIVPVVRLPHGLTAKSIAAARDIKFTPAMKDGRPVSMWMELQYNYSLY